MRFACLYHLKIIRPVVAVARVEVPGLKELHGVLLYLESVATRLYYNL